MFHTSVVSEFCGSSNNEADCPSLGRLGTLAYMSGLGGHVEKYGRRKETIRSGGAGERTLSASL